MSCCILLWLHDLRAAVTLSMSSLGLTAWHPPDLDRLSQRLPIDAPALTPSPCSWAQLVAINAVGNLGGAVAFLLAALAACLEQGNPQHP